jgi:hypothetical protein
VTECKFVSKHGAMRAFGRRDDPLDGRRLDSTDPELADALDTSACSVMAGDRALDNTCSRCSLGVPGRKSRCQAHTAGELSP